MTTSSHVVRILFVTHVLLVVLSPTSPARADGSLIEELTYEQQPGLPPAASKIFFSERPYAISGYGELAYVGYLGEKSRATDDIELYYTNLYRFVLYGAYRPVSWLVLYAEIFAELYHDGTREVDYEFFPEAFVDFLIARGFNLRVGWAQVPIGYVNTNDEPIQFHSVNRTDVERLIVPSQWIDLGVQLYGSFGRFEWIVGLFQGLDGDEFLESSWIRRGREMRFHFRAPAVAGQIAYRPVDELELNLSGVYSEAGKNQRILVDGEISRVRAPTTLFAAYARFETAGFNVIAFGTAGFMGETDRIYALTSLGDRGPQALGARTYGYYVEAGWDLFSVLRPRSSSAPRHSFFFRSDELKLPLFLRYERLDTHARLDDRLAERLPADVRVQRSDLDIVTIGANFNPRRSIVLKANYQFRRNREPGFPEANRLEAGLGFIF